MDSIMLEEDRVEKVRKPGKVKTFFRYFALYLMVTIILTAGIVMITPTVVIKPPALNASTQDDEPPTPMAQLISSLMSTSDMKLMGNIAIDTEDAGLVDIDCEISLKIAEGFKDVQAEVNGRVKFNGQSYDFGVVYDGDLYLTINNVSFKVRNKTIMQAVGIVMNALNIDLDLDNIASSFDMGMVAKLGDKLVVTEGEEFNDIVFELTDDIKINIKTDKDFNLKNVSFPETIIENVGLKADIAVDTTKKVAITAPAKFIEVPDITEFIEPINKIIEKKGLTSEVQLNIDGVKVDVLLNARFDNDFDFEFKTNILGVELNGIIKGNEVYLQVNDLKYKFKVGNFVEIVNWAMSTFVDEKINISLADISSFSVDKILAIAGKIISSGFGGVDARFSVSEYGEVVADVTYEKATAIVKLYANDEKIEYDDSDHMEVVVNPSTLQSFYDRLTGQKYNFDFEICDRGNIYTANVKVDLSDGFKAEATTTILGSRLTILIFDDYIYMSIENLKFKAKISELDSLLNEIVDVITDENENEEISKPSGDKIAEEIKTILNIKVSDIFEQLKVKNIVINENVVSFSILGANQLIKYLPEGPIDFRFEIEDDFLSNITVINGENYAKTILKDNNFVVSSISEDEEKEYDTSVSDMVGAVKSVKEAIKSKYINGKFVVTYKDQQYEINVNFQNDNGIRVYFQTEIMGVGVEGWFVENKIYLSVLNVNLVLGVDELPKMLNYIQSLTGVTFDQKDFDQLKENFKEFKLGIIDKLKAESSEIYIQITNNLSIDIKMADSKISNVEVNFNELALNVDINYDVNVIELPNKEFNNLSDVFNQVFKIKDLIDAKNLEGSMNLTFLGRTIAIDYKILTENELYVQLVASYKSYSATIILDNEDIYISVLDLNLHSKITNLDELIGLLGKYVNVNVDMNDSKEILLAGIKELVEKGFDTFKFNENIIDIKALGLNFAVEINENLVAEILFDDVNIRFNLEKANDLNKISINKAEYVEIVDIVELVDNTMEYIKSGKYYADMDLDIKGYNIKGFVGFEDGNIKAELKTKVLERDIEVKLVNEIVYLNIDGLKLKFGLNETDKILEFVKETFNVEIPNVNIEEISGKLPNLNEITEEEILGIISKIALSLSANELQLNYENISALVNIKDNRLNSISVSYEDIVGTLTISDDKQIKVEGAYYNLTDFMNLVKATYETLKNKAISGNLNLIFEVMGDKQILNVDYGVKLEENQIVGYFKTSFKGINIDIYVENNTLYINLDGLRIYGKFNELNDFITWLNENLNANLELTKAINLDDYHLGMIENILISSTTASCDFKDYKFCLRYSDLVDYVNFKSNGIELQIDCKEFSKFELDNINQADYDHYTVCTNIFEILVETVKEDGFDILGSADVYANNVLKYRAQGLVQLDFKDGFKGNANVKLGKELTTPLDIHYENDYLFLNYNGFRIKLQRNSIKEILSIILEMFGINTNSLPFIDSVPDDLELNMDNLKTAIPAIDLENPLNMLELVKGISLKDGVYTLTLDGKAINENAESDMTVSFFTADSKLEAIVLNNICTSGDEYFNLRIDFNKFNGVSAVDTSKEFIDLSDASSLLKAFVNTSNLNDYHISGGVIMNLKLGSLEIKAAELSVDINVKLDAYKKPIIAMEIGKYPLIGGVNNSNTNGVGGTGLGAINIRERKISIYYKDGEILLKTCDEKWGAYKELNRATRITPDYLFSNLGAYMQWLLGFTDTIQTKINEAIETCNNNKAEAEKNGTLDYSDIILNYQKSGNTHSCDVNIGKLAYNDQIGSLHIDLTIINNASTNNKDYIGALNFNMDLLDSLIILKTNDKTKLELIDIGKPANIDNAIVNLNNAIFQLDGEYEKTGDGSWKLANQGERTVKFYDGDTLISSKTGSIGTALNFPSIETTKTIDDGETRKIYEFKGWYTSDGKEYTSSAYPRYDTELYAEWDLVSDLKYVTISFITNENVSINNMKDLETSTLILPVLSNIETMIDENTSVLKIFKGWYLDKDLTKEFTANVYPNSDITLYAKWSEITTQTCSLSIYSAGNLIYSGKVEAGAKFVFPVNIYFNETTRYYTSSNFNESNLVTNFEINQNTVWYARNKYNVELNSEYTTKNGGSYSSTVTDYEGSNISLPSYSNYEIDNISYVTKYVFKGWKLEGDNTIVSGSIIIPSNEAKYIAVWEVKDYVTISFNPNGWKNPAWWTISRNISHKSTGSVSNTTGNKLTVEKGTTIDLTKYKATCVYSYKAFGINKDYTFETVAWAETCVNLYDTAASSQNYSGATTMQINSHITLQPVWKHV